MTEITIAQALSRLIKIAEANAQNARLILSFTEVIQKHVAELEAEIEKMREERESVN